MGFETEVDLAKESLRSRRAVCETQNRLKKDSEENSKSTLKKSIRSFVCQVMSKEFVKKAFPFFESKKNSALR
ncbi:hypothetical protein LEP1GSC052_3883 [Leptospira kmetyi serovar Malaysia str. Bejo-Iso9]|nr:hypothetical protein LEP1GSC052_3883 [Leptospira kmetyi serovar Malaysia str. Bejo-Iso9]